MVRGSVVSSLRFSLSSPRATTPGELPSPKRRRQGRLLRTVAWAGLFVVDLWAGVTRGSPGRRGTLVGQCFRPLCPGDPTSHLIGPAAVTACPRQRTSCDPRPMLPPVRGLGIPTRPNRGTSRTLFAWPLRHRLLPCGAGCVPPLREFERRVPHGRGPAEVGFDEGCSRAHHASHRLRLSQKHLQLTPHSVCRPQVRPRHTECACYFLAVLRAIRRITV